MRSLCEFALPGPLRDRLVEAVLDESKTATTSLLAEWELDGEAFPPVGERQTVVDSKQVPVAIIEIAAVEAIRLGDADHQLALDEGEGYQSVEEWRTAHERFWRHEVIPDLPGRFDLPLNDDTQIVVERFKLISRSRS